MAERTARINQETGETITDLIICITTSRRDMDTGEYEYKRRKHNTFKIPIRTVNAAPTAVWHSASDARKLAKRQKYVAAFFLLLVSLKMILPSLAVLIFELVAKLRHTNIHERINRGELIKMPRHHKLLYSQFCVLCQSEMRMYTIGKMQDSRSSVVFQGKDFRKYASDLVIASAT